MTTLMNNGKAGTVETQSGGCSAFEHVITSKEGNLIIELNVFGAD